MRVVYHEEVHVSHLNISIISGGNGVRLARYTITTFMERVEK
jgi:hypothetical protein